MRVWLRVGRGWGVSLGFWGTLFYAFGYLMWLALLAAVLVGAALVSAVVFLIAALGRHVRSKGLGTTQ